MGICAAQLNEENRPKAAHSETHRLGHREIPVYEPRRPNKVMTTELPSKVRRERRPPPSMDQRKAQLDALGRAIDAICASWEDALSASQSRGYPIQSPGPKAAAGIVRFDPNDPLHTRSMPGASGSSSAFGDATGNAAMQPHTADGWIADARACLVLLLAMSPADERIDPDGYLGHARPRWSGPFWPPHLRLNFRKAAEDVVTLWPRNCALLFERIHVLANVARSEWPATPKAGTTVSTPDGDVIVGGGRLETGVTCAGCGRYASGDASDPVSRIDDRPYHRKPGPGHGACYFSVRRSNDAKS